ncbi:hypothetical protein [Alicyclobacillus sp. ALC3]|uniref:hypothetical protein n=1 Tax=Alicyclobacillus sp. ALC3 TaxID=2796143 RepID=UPI002379A1D4|nr:hypothetical protein [Alicyclobacillus sp. ALC3]WDL98160.1 hypothetical protein JC200_05515 [Alicyclobacillus sp. ALC3]
MAQNAATMNAGKVPAMVRQIGGTTIRVYAPDPVSEEEAKRIRERIARAVARCLETANQ